jgi:N-acetyl-gamma-glutamyl-phosphate reductase
VIKVAIVGASGYTAAELIRILLGHRKVELCGLYAFTKAGRSLTDVHPQFRGFADAKLERPDYERLGRETDLVFFATPHTVSMHHVPTVLDGGARVVDLSADYRFDDPAVYERYYTKHASPDLKAVYGLPEIYRREIKEAKLVANPGCYPTAAILALAPLVKNELIDLEKIVIDAKSGSSGAGASPSERTHHPMLEENITAYAATTHRHRPEIEQELSKLAKQKVTVHFTPHLIPVVRGILLTAHVFLKEVKETTELLELYHEFFRGEPFVRIRKTLPQTKQVLGSNYCDIGIEVDTEGRRAVIVAAIDNLTKGASGQAVQNMNLMFGIDETEGLRLPPLCP